MPNSLERGNLNTDRLSNRTILIDVHAMPVLKELVVYSVIERITEALLATVEPDHPRIAVLQVVRF